MNVLLAALLAALLGLNPARGESLAQRHFETGLKLMAKGRLKDARAEMQVALQLEPGNPDFQKGLREVSEGTPIAESQALSPAASAQAPPGASRADAMLREAAAFYADSRLKDAEEAWRRVIQLEPGNTLAAQSLQQMEREKYRSDSGRSFDSTLAGFYEGAWKDIRKGRFLDAQSKIDEGLKLNPGQEQFKELSVEVAQRAERQKNAQAAQDLCQQGEALLEQGRLQEAREKLEAALEAVPEDPRASKALESLEKTAKPKATALNAAGSKALKAGDWEKARNAFKRSLALSPKDAQALAGLAAAESHLESSTRQAETREKAKKECNLGVEALGAGDFAKAGEHFDAALKTDPTDEEAAKGLQQAKAKVAEQAGQFQAQIKDWQEEAARLESRGALEASMELHKKVLFKDPVNAKSLKAVERLAREMGK